MALNQPAAYPRLAGLGDIPRLVSSDRVHREWPPTGTTVVSSGFPETWPLVYGEPTRGEVGDWWVTDLATVVLGINGNLANFAARVGATASGLATMGLTSLGEWPVIYVQGEGQRMRWISSVVRGTLGGIEQFQFGCNWGNPGSDPDPNEAETAAFAETLRVQLGAALLLNGGGGTCLQMFASDVKFVEVGATVKTQTDATDSSGHGGNLEQKFDTQWAAWPVGAQPTGAAVGNSLPYEVACAATLQTEKRGPSGRGRIYLPPLGVTGMTTGGRFNPFTVGILGDMLGAWFDGVTSATSHVPVVVSRRRIILNEVTSIAMGAVPDSQRRRRRSQDEARVVAWST